MPNKYEILSDDDEIVRELDVVVCDKTDNADLFCVSFPTRKKHVWEQDRNPRVRYKKNVRLLEMALNSEPHSGSYDKKKAELMGASVHHGSLNEVYEGRAFKSENPLISAVGYFKDDKLFINPVSGTFEMHRSLNEYNGKKKGGNKEDDGDVTEESDTEAGTTAGGSGQLRVKFARPETERQKKRREASALHRQKKMESDTWLNMDIHLCDEDVIGEKLQSMTKSMTANGSNGDVEMREGEEKSESDELRKLVNSAILCTIREQLVVEHGKEHMLSKQRIRELPIDQQVRAHMIKAHVMRTSDMVQTMSAVGRSRDDVIEDLKQCSYLVKGVWVLKSDFLFNNLPPAHSNVPGRVDTYRTELWRSARDFALCLVDAGHRLTRLTLTKSFHLNEKDAEEVLQTFGVKDEISRSWKLIIDGDDYFTQDPSNLQLIVEQKRAIVEKWEILQQDLRKVSSPKKKK